MYTRVSDRNIEYKRYLNGFFRGIVVDDNDQIITYKIVGEDESDIENGRLSYKSPLSRAMIGKSTDDLVELKTSEITQEFQVTDIKYK